MPQRERKANAEARKLRLRGSEKEEGGEEMGGLLHLNEKEKLSCHGGEKRGGLGRRTEPGLIDPISVCRNRQTTGESDRRKKRIRKKDREQRKMMTARTLL